VEAADEALSSVSTDAVREQVIHYLRVLALDADAQGRYAFDASAPAWVRAGSPLAMLLENFSEFVGAIGPSEEWNAMRQRDTSVFELDALADLVLLAAARGGYDLRRAQILEDDALWILIRRLARASLSALGEGRGPIAPLEVLCAGASIESS
jgi:hypothetical protein